jgi:hypothetical protein
MPRTWFDADAVEQVVDVAFRFARDSSLEGDGFEPSVPRQIRSRFESRSASHDGRFEAASPCGSLWREVYKAS